MFHKFIKLSVSTLISLSVNAEFKEASVVITTDYVDWENLANSSLSGASYNYYNILDRGLSSGTLSIEGSYLRDGESATFSSNYSIEDLRLDEDKNGIYDFLDYTRDYVHDFTGVENQSIAGSSISLSREFTISRGNFSRSYNAVSSNKVISSTGTISNYYSPGDNIIADPFTGFPYGAIGSLIYERSNLTYSIDLEFSEEKKVLQNSIFEIIGEDTINIHNFPILKPDGSTHYLDLTLNRLNSTDADFFFSRQLQVGDVTYCVFIIDRNDFNGDGVPDISDNIHAISNSNTLKLGQSSVTPPSSLVGNIFTESYFDSYLSEQVTGTIYFPSESQYFSKQQTKASEPLGSDAGQYQWLVSGNQGTLTTSGIGGIAIFSLSFDSNSSGNSTYSFPGEENVLGTFTISEAPSVNVPTSLVGKIYTESYYQPEKVTETLFFKSSTEVITFYDNENSGPSEINLNTYTWTKSGSQATLVVSYPPEPAFPEEGSTLGTYSLFFESETNGLDYFQGTDNYSITGAFILNEGASGFAPSTIVNGQLLSDEVTHVFKENDLVEVRSEDGLTEKTFRYIKTGLNTARLETPISDPGPDLSWGTSDDQNATKIQLIFSSDGGGTLSGDATGSFSYYPEGSAAPTTKGWMWFDLYPWVYSHEEQGWLYFAPSSAKLMIYSDRDKAWREMQ
ncbi:MAG TPA: hypothetical protein DHU78_01740 [Opitutae bacterium]|nr:hypothetical protein [Opitutae bacterium]|tara:strand:- start:462 stop:2498 length:2037 start_codon:yes stop_codon:yes gene_type:complete